MNDDYCYVTSCRRFAEIILVRGGKRFPLCDLHTQQVMAEDPAAAKRACSRLGVPNVEKCAEEWGPDEEPGRLWREDGSPVHAGAEEPEDTEYMDAPDIDDESFFADDDELEPDVDTLDDIDIDGDDPSMRRSILERATAADCSGDCGLSLFDDYDEEE